MYITNIHRLERLPEEHKRTQLCSSAREAARGTYAPILFTRFFPFSESAFGLWSCLRSSSAPFLSPCSSPRSVLPLCPSLIQCVLDQSSSSCARPLLLCPSLLLRLVSPATALVGITPPGPAPPAPAGATPSAPAPP
jgi:hypothetical protein